MEPAPRGCTVLLPLSALEALELPSRQAVSEPPRAPQVVPSRGGRLTSSAPCFTPERGWSAPTAGAIGPGGALAMLSAHGAATAAVLRAALSRSKRASGRAQGASR